MLNGEAADRFWVSGVGSQLWGVIETPAFPMKSEADYLDLVIFSAYPTNSVIRATSVIPGGISWGLFRACFRRCLEDTEDSSEELQIDTYNVVVEK